MTTDKFCFYVQNRLIQTSQTGGQRYSDTSLLVFPALAPGEKNWQLIHPINLFLFTLSASPVLLRET
jgi:hypothetical protein